MAIPDFDHLKGTYFEECAELIESVYAHLAMLDQQAGDNDTVHAIFRAIHSIKGGGGAFGFARMVAFAHMLESVLDLLRDGKIACSAALLSLLTRCTDVLSDLVAAERSGQRAAEGIEDDLLRELGQVALQSSLSSAIPAAPPSGRLAGASALPVEQRRFRIQFVPTREAFRTGNEPLLLIRELMRMGEVSAIPDLARMPPLHEIDPEGAYIGWTIDLLTVATEADIAEVFEFVVHLCDLSIVPFEGVADPQQPQAAPAAPAPATRPGEQATAAAEVAEPTPTRRREDCLAPQSVRVDTEKVDRLVNLVGELVINQAMLVQLGSVLPSDLCPGLVNGLATLSQHLRELQEGVMAIRTQPVRSVFLRMPRLMRELSSQLGKDVRLVITGENTEIDKTVIEQLADPLTHLLRNALDHGIETPEDRESAGKSRQGTIYLAAEHRGGRILIEVSDDGGGIRRDRVLNRARARGLVSADEQPTDDQIDDMIFLPGFSTAETVSSISGRGVGMDVVRRNIQALGGRIAVQSRLGEGSRFVLSLPLTLAIMDGMVVAVGREFYIVPLTNIVESLRPKRSEIHHVAGCGDVVSIRGNYVPLIYLHRDFGVPDAEDDPSRAIVVVVENDTAGQFGLVVDELVGQQQIVVKSLERNYGTIAGVGGATILGNGRVALILDVADLRQAAGDRASRRRGSMGSATITSTAFASPLAEDRLQCRH